MSKEENNQMDPGRVGAGIAVGLAMGGAVGVTMDNIGLGIAIGMGIGVAFIRSRLTRDDSETASC